MTVLSDEECEKWLQDFINQKKMDEASFEEMLSAWDNCGTRRVKFAHEVKMIETLFQPIAKLIERELKDDRDQRGIKLYREWGKQRLVPVFTS
ncbi:unnamed protein product [Protopolystoma xenopodis]|uniref:Uncharacterized protein n=1 Tax=Protopolystoma xenopodis TaxID=117903 RepID=A0A3S4ZS43_9PLAT|nr:unnamed protein product [Protopolystoma xenopodis]